MIDLTARERGCLRDRSLKQSSCKSPIIWWMVYLPNRWGETCIEINWWFFGGFSWPQNRLQIWIIRLCSLSGSELEMNLSCEWFSNAAWLIYHLGLSCSVAGKKMGLSIMRHHTCVDFNQHKTQGILKDPETVWQSVINSTFKRFLCTQRKFEPHYGKTIISYPLFSFTGGPCFYVLMYHKWTI